MNKTVRYKMRDLINFTLEQLEEHPQVPIIVECDDGEVETIREEIILSWFLWQMHREYPNTPCSVKHHYAGKTITPKTHLDILSHIQKDAFFEYRKSEYESILPFNKVVYKSYNMLYNYMSGELTPFMTSISALDYIEVMNHPEIKEANDWIQSLDTVNDGDIYKVYQVIEDVLSRDGVLEDNSLRRAYKHRIVPIDQIWQDIGPRGFVNDIDQHILPKPITVGYAEGLHELTDILEESRTGTQAKLMTGTPMQAAEYLNRLLQLSVSRVSNLYRGDCGTTEFSEWFVDDEKNLKGLRGMYYLNEQTGKQEPIDPKLHQHLIGTSIRLRTVFNCKHTDRQSVCAKCFGDIAFSIPDNDNIGHISTIEFQSDNSQKVLSFKHHTGSSKGRGVAMDNVANKYFKLHKDKRSIVFTHTLPLQGLKITVPRTSVRGFSNLRQDTDFSQISPIRISKVTQLAITVGDGETYLMDIADDTNPVYFTLQALKFINKPSRFKINDEGDYEFDMSEWRIDEKLFGIPKVQFDIIKYTEQLESFIKGTKSSKRAGDNETVLDFDNPIPALSAFFELSSQKLNVPLSHLQVILLSTMCEDPQNGDYRLPLDRMHGVFASNNDIMRNSSSSVALGYEEQEIDVYKVDSYLGNPRPFHEADWLVLGDDAV